MHKNVKPASSPKTVMLILPELHPVPDIKGGSVELLVTNLLRENEKYNELRFIVISKYDEDAVKYHFKNSKIYYYRDGWFADDLIKGKKLLWGGYFAYQEKRKGFAKKFINKTVHFDRRLFQCLRVAKKEHAEVLVFENFYYPGSYIPLIRYFDRENVFMHIHYHREEVLSDRMVVSNSISISEFVKKEWAKDKSIVGKNKVLYNCIDPQKYDITVTTLEKEKRKRELGISPDDKVVVFCGRFIPQKGIKELLDAFDILDGKSVKLLLIGCYSYEKLNITPYSKEMAARAEKMGNVIYLGYIPNAKMQDYYAVSDMMVIPSIWQEGAGLVTIEGMAAGLPLIITDSGGMVEYVNDECAIKVPINDDLPRNLAAQIERLSGDAALRKEMGEAGKARAKRFNPKSFYDSYVRIVKGDK